MNRNKFVVIILLLIVIVAIVAIVSFTSLPETSSDNVVNLDEITFHTSNSTDFSKTIEKNESSYHITYYTYENYFVNVIEFADDADQNLIDSILNSHANFPSQTIGGVTVYTESGSTGEDISEEIYVSTVYDTDLNEIVIFGSSDADETAKMASTLKFYK